MPWVVPVPIRVGVEGVKSALAAEAQSAVETEFMSAAADEAQSAAAVESAAAKGESAAAADITSAGTPTSVLSRLEHALRDQFERVYPTARELQRRKEQEERFRASEAGYQSVELEFDGDDLEEDDD